LWGSREKWFWGRFHTKVVAGSNSSFFRVSWF
jgi:hypothetical protein